MEVVVEAVMDAVVEAVVEAGRPGVGTGRIEILGYELSLCLAERVALGFFLLL